MIGNNTKDTLLIDEKIKYKCMNTDNQDDVENNTEVNGFLKEDASDTNQTSSPSSSFNLFEGNNENIQLQEM